MERKYVKFQILVCLLLGVFLMQAEVRAQEYSWENISNEYQHINAVLISPDNPGLIFIATNNSLLKTNQEDKTWSMLLRVRQGINFIFSDPDQKQVLFVCTGNGLYQSADFGSHWKRVFRGRNELENNCTAFLSSNGAYYLGTQRGLLISRDQARSWQKAEGWLADNQVINIIADKRSPQHIYVCAVCGVFSSKDAGASWRRIYVSRKNEFQAISDTDNQDYALNSSDVRYLALDNTANILYLATSAGVLKSENQQASWEQIPDFGLLEKEIRFIAVFPDSRIFCLTKNGVFKLEEHRWREISLNFPSCIPNMLAYDKFYNIYIAADKGLFKSALENYAKNLDNSSAELYMQDEPDIKAVQKAAIKYAEVEPEKILRWRKQLAKRAFLPKVTTRINRDASDLWHWETGSTTKAGDDLLIRGKETVGWDVSLTWDLSEVIWSSEQTTIDNRSKLMVELRQDILDEVTKLYFERLRIKTEIDRVPIEERKRIFEKNIRLKELDAMLDGLTGGYFSSQLKR